MGNDLEFILAGIQAILFSDLHFDLLIICRYEFGYMYDNAVDVQWVGFIIPGGGKPRLRLIILRREGLEDALADLCLLSNC